MIGITVFERIINSRFKKNIEEDWILDRQKECNKCKYNTRNMLKISLKQKFINLLSNILTLTLTAKLNTDDDACSICTCTLKYKQKEKLETCPKNKWKN